MKQLEVKLATEGRGKPYDHYEVTQKLLQKMAYRGSAAEGVVAVFDQPTWGFEDLAGGQAGLWLIAVGITKPGNLGAMARSVAAAGGSGLLVADQQVDPFNPNAICASTGAVFSLPVVCAAADSILKWLTEHHIRLFAGAAEAPTAYDQADWTDAAALAIGTEAKGLDEQWLGAADRSGGRIAIPMANGSVDSLNASVATGVLLFEAARQRRATDRR